MVSTIFHVANGNTIVIRDTHNSVLNLFPAPTDVIDFQFGNRRHCAIGFIVTVGGAFQAVGGAFQPVDVVF